MKFELSIACSYLLPTRLNWSRSLMGLLSIFVVSSVVWLAMVFLSVSAGLQHLWIKKLIAIDAPVRIRPTSHYFNSYFYNVDSLSKLSNYQNKNLLEKSKASNADPYQSDIDGPLPTDLASPDLDQMGHLKNPVKMLIASLNQLSKIEYADCTTALSNCIVDVRENWSGESAKSHRSYHQLSLTAPLIWRGELIEQIQKSDEVEWCPFFDKWFDIIANGDEEKAKIIWRHLNIAALNTRSEGLLLAPSQRPAFGSFEAIAVNCELHICNDKKDLKDLQKRFGEKAQRVRGKFKKADIQIDYFPKTTWSLIYHGPLSLSAPITPSGQELNWRQIPISAQCTIQGNDLHFPISLGQLAIKDIKAKGNKCEAEAIATALKECELLDTNSCKAVNTQTPFGAVLPLHYRRSGARIGDLGCLQRSIITPVGVEFEDLSLMICGFFDTGMIPNGAKIILVDPKCCALLHETMPEDEQRHHCGFSIFCSIDKAPFIAQQIKELLKKGGIEKYWSVQSYEDFDHIRDLLGQLKSDQLLLGVLAVIIIGIACSNIISMLLLLVVEKKREIAIFRALGASSATIGRIFSLCGFLTGLISGIIGSLLAWLTLSHIDSLTHFLSWVWGRQLFHPLYYGDKLPSRMTASAIAFTLITTAVFSALAALIPARSAARLDPSKLLRDY